MLTHQNAFMFDQLVSCSVGIGSSTTSDIRLMPWVGLWSKSRTSQLCFDSVSFMESFVLEEQVLFRVDSLCDFGPYGSVS